MNGITDHTRHYLFEPNSFVPLAQVVEQGEQTHTAYYHVDQLGTPQLLSDEAGDIAWSAEYKAWGEAKAIISEAAQAAGIDNPLRFQGQYFDEESGLHYNRHRYYDPETGRFISSDPIGLMGGLNTHAYVPNPVEWVDPLGLARRGNPATRTHMDQVRDQTHADNPGIRHVDGGRDQSTQLDLPEKYLPPINQTCSVGGKKSTKGCSYTDMTFEDAQGTTVHVQTVDKGNVNGMSQREWDNATRITQQDPGAIVVTVRKGTVTPPGSLDTSKMAHGTVNKR